MGAQARIGCSGWSYSDWRGVVYPVDVPPTRWFGWYAARFDTVELNATHYRRPTAAAVDRWAAQAPPGFTYAVKVHRFGTHWRRLGDAAAWMPHVVDPMLPLGDHLGPFLLQVPAGRPPRADRLAEVLDIAAARAPGTRWALEVRDTRWWCDEVLAVLEQHGAALVVHDLLPDHPWVATAGFTYVRCHGPDSGTRPYCGAYSPEALAALAHRVDAELADDRDVYVYFNNDVGGHAPDDARRLRSLVTGSAR